MSTKEKHPIELYKLDIGKIPDELYHVDTPVEKLLERCETVSADGTPGTTSDVSFPPGSLHKVNDVPKDVEWERMIGIPLYMSLNTLPFIVVITASLMVGSKFVTRVGIPIILADYESNIIYQACIVYNSIAFYVLSVILTYVIGLFSIWYFYFAPLFERKYGDRVRKIKRIF